MVRPTEFRITRTTTEAGVALGVCGELDLSTVPVLAEAFGRIKPEAGAVTLDLSELSFMDSTGLRLLIELALRARREGWKLTMLRPAHVTATAVLQATGADSALPFEDGQLE